MIGIIDTHCHRAYTNIVTRCRSLRLQTKNSDSVGVSLFQTVIPSTNCSQENSALALKPLEDSGPVAQSGRAAPCHGVRRGFKSRQVHHLLMQVCPLFEMTINGAYPYDMREPALAGSLIPFPAAISSSG